MPAANGFCIFAREYYAMQFVDLKNDIAFRKIFGNEKKSAPLISFLNAALELEGNKKVVSVTLSNPNLFPRIAGEKASILDVRATDQAGRKFVVEMQVAEKDGFDKRVQYYLSRDYSMQINRGEDYPLLNPAYFIGILDFEFSISENYHTRHLILEKTTNEHLLKDIEFSFVELPKFNLALDELSTPIDKWTYFIKHAEELTFIPDYANEDEGLKVAFIEADKHNWSKEDLVAYDNASIAEQDERGKITAAEKKGGKKRELEIAKELLTRGVDSELIKISTGLTDDEIEELKNH
ncbi:MAG: Rpn family recombination-promoting nuclease/putative transposase [Saprospiraceae bacterium]|nr:Rpn family recombination-promoting nuclease/putative transposase [Saprospiraceae bacterium]